MVRPCFPQDRGHIGDGIIYCGVEDVSKLPAVAKPHDGHGQIARRRVPHDPLFADYDAAFRSHHGSTFATTVWGYEFYLPGYRFGYTLAAEEPNAARTFEQVEPRAREAFVGRHGDNDYTNHREAIRHGYEYHRQQLLRGGGM